MIVPILESPCLPLPYNAPCRLLLLHKRSGEEKEGEKAQWGRIFEDFSLLFYDSLGSLDFACSLSADQRVITVTFKEGEGGETRLFSAVDQRRARECGIWRELDNSVREY